LEIVSAQLIATSQPNRRHAARLRWRSQTAIKRIKVLLDHFERKVSITLGKKDVTKSFQINACELPITRWRPLGINQPLCFQKSDLGDRHIWEFGSQLAQYLTDTQIGTRWNAHQESLTFRFNLASAR
jgi:hypothetical protein